MSPNRGPVPLGGAVANAAEGPTPKKHNPITLSSRGWCPGPDDGSLAETKSWIHRSMRSASVIPVTTYRAAACLNISAQSHVFEQVVAPYVGPGGTLAVREGMGGHGFISARLPSSCPGHLD